MAYIPPLSPLRAGESKKYRSQRKYSIRKSNKIRETNVKDKSHHAALERVFIQIISIQAADLSREHYATLYHVCIQIMSI